MFKLAQSRLLHQIVCGSEGTHLEARKPENPAAPAQAPSCSGHALRFPVLFYRLRSAHVSSKRDIHVNRRRSA